MLKPKIKLCKCGTKLGQKVRTCYKCKHKFEFKKIIKNAKKCPNCFIELRPRAKECNKCQYKFPEKKKRGYEEIEKNEWKNLKKMKFSILEKVG